MKQSIIVFFVFILFSCSQKPHDKAVSNIKEFLETNLNNPKSYTPIKFSSIDTLELDSITNTLAILHKYKHKNSSNDLVTISRWFQLDSLFEIKKDPYCYQGDYGSIEGNAFWEYNKYVGNRADVGTKIKVYPFDTLRSKDVYTTEVDMEGKFKIEKIPCGTYILIARSANTNQSTESHLSNFRYGLSSLLCNRFFNYYFEDSFNIELSKRDSLRDATVKFISTQSNNYPNRQQFFDKYLHLGAKTTELEDSILYNLPKFYNTEIGFNFYFKYSLEFKFIRIEEGKKEIVMIDFGNTYTDLK